MLRRPFSFVMFLLFAYATAVQLNDPDAPFWIVLYGYPCVLALVDALGRNLPVRLLQVSTALYLIYLALRALNLFFPSTIPVPFTSGVDPGMVVDTALSFANENVRETVGVAICAGWLSVVTQRKN